MQVSVPTSAGYGKSFEGTTIRFCSVCQISLHSCAVVSLSFETCWWKVLLQCVPGSSKCKMHYQATFHLGKVVPRIACLLSNMSICVMCFVIVPWVAGYAPLLSAFTACSAGVAVVRINPMLATLHCKLAS